jgi:hypothetical protein
VAVLRSILLPFLAIIAVCLWIVLGVWFGLSRTVLSDEFVLDLLERHDFYEVVTQSINEIASDVVRAKLSAADTQTVEDILSSVISEEWARKEVERNLAGALAFLRGEDDSFRILLDTREPKSLLKSELSRSYPRRVIERIEPYLADIPETMDLSSHWGMGDESWMKQYSRYHPYLPYLAGLLAVMVLISFVLSGIAGGMQWTGSTALVPGILLILGFTVGISVGIRAIEREILSFESAYGSFGLDAAVDALKAISAPIRNFGIALTCVGAVLVGGSYFLKSIGLRMPEDRH